MMKKMIALALAAVLLLGILPGCNAEESVLTHIAVVGAAHSNSMGLPLTGDTTTALVEQLCRSGGQLTLVTTEGVPRVVNTVSVERPDTSLTAKRQQTIINGNGQKILAWIEKHAVASTPELDVLGALQKGARALAGQDGKRYLILCSTLLSTAGPMDFRNDLLNADPAEIVDALDANSEIPDLKGVDVIVIGAGDVCIQELSSKDKQKLHDIWQNLLERTGAASVTFASELPGEAVSGLPYISIVGTGTADEEKLPEPVILDPQSVSFVANQAVFLDAAAAKRALEPIAELLLEHPDFKILLVGCTASGTEFTKVLSQQRADACMALLTDEYQVPAHQIVALGMGFENPWHVEDRDPDGNFNENAALNRKTVIMNYNSQEAEQILASIEEVA